MRDPNDGSVIMEGDELGALFRRASRMMARSHHRCFQAPQAQRHVFSMIQEHGPIAQSELLEMLDVRSSSLSEILRKLEKNGLIVRMRNEADKRGFILSVNEGGGLASVDAQEAPQESAYAFFSCLEEGERQQLAALLSKIIVHLDQDEQGGRGRGNGPRHHKEGGRSGIPGGQGRCAFHGHPARGRGNKKY